jgi:hypothetical protein
MSIFQRAAHALTATLLSSLPLAAAAVPVIEFYNTGLDNYFITADPIEVAAIDRGSAGPGWIRTGGTFDAGGASPVCRFYGSISPGPNSHFYTVLPDECESLKQLQAVTPASQKRWNFESLDFVTTAPGPGGACPAGKLPIYRAYNDGFGRGVDSNHRITADQVALQQVVNRGWRNEGVVMCAPGPLAAANCAALRSGTYRIVTPTANASVRTLTAVLDATTMTFRFSDGRTDTWSADGPCKFVQAGVNRFVVSPSGLAVWTSAYFGSGIKVSLMFPEQTIQAGELEGTWNTLAFGRDDDSRPYDLGSFMIAFSPSGSITTASECVLLAPCSPLAGPFPTFVNSVSGGLVATDEADTRIYAFRAPSGDLMFVWVESNLLLMVGSRTRTIPAPTVGTVNSFSNLTISPNGTPSALSDGGFTITAVDTSAKTYTRVSTMDGHPETLNYNKPRDGLSYRAAATAPTSSGGTVNVSETYFLGLPGSGLTVFGRPTNATVNAFYGFSVASP